MKAFEGRKVYFEGRGEALCRVDAVDGAVVVLVEFPTGEKYGANGDQLLDILLINSAHTLPEILAQMMDGLDSAIAKTEGN